MAKMFKKTFAMMLALCMLVGMLPVQALGEEAIVTPDMVTTIDAGEETPVVVVSIVPDAESEEGERKAESEITTEETFEENFGFAEDGVEVDEEKIEIEETVNKNTETTTDEEGNTVVTETIETEVSGTIEEGAFEGVIEGTLEGEETYTETTVTNPAGKEIGHAWEQEGSETLEYVTEEVEGAPQPDVTVELIPGEKTEATSDPITEVTGDVAEGEDDTEYDYTETTTTDRTVTAETSDVEISVNDASTGLVGEQETQLKGLDPVYDETDDLHINSSNGQPLDKVDGEHVGKDDVFDRNYLSTGTEQTHDCITLDNGVVIWVDDASSDRKIIDIVVPEGVELPEDFGYSVGDSAKEWFTNLAANPATKNMPAGSKTKNNVKDTATGKTHDRITLDNGIVVWVNDKEWTVENVVLPEGMELPEGFEYGIGADVRKWYYGTVAGNPVAGNMPEDSAAHNNVDLTKAENWYNGDGELIVTIPEGADFKYVGTGEHSKFFTARVYVVYAKDENGNPIKDENGNYVVESLKTGETGSVVTIDGVPTTELPDGVSLKPIYDNYGGSRPTTFMLTDKYGNKVYAYCCDMVTGANKGTWYSVQNLEDCDYYASEESEEHIRSIVMNGYWGTSDIPNEDGTYQTGSLEKIKQGLRDAIASGKMENEMIELPALDADGNPIVDEEGNPVMESVTMMELIDELTEGEALLATQAAIWSFSNGSIGVKNGKDGLVIFDADGYKWNHDPSSNSKDGEAMDDYGSARVDFLYSWLIALDTEEESTIVINEKNFVEDVTLTVHDKVEDAERNNDEDQNNDVYNTDLNFKLAFIPGPNDDLLVQVTYTDFEGNVQNVVRRLAGSNAEGQTFEDIRPDTDGSYVIKGLKLSENEDFNFDLRLEGTQYLEEGVYVYQAVGGRDVSQTFVGIAEGTRNVDVSMGVTIKFDVDENNRVVATRTWRSEGDPQDEDPPRNYRYTPGTDTTIEEEPVPLAEVPQTGDNSVVWFAMIVFAALGLCVIELSGKKCKA